MSLSKAYHFVKAEILEVLPAIIYFLIAFNLIYFTIGLGLSQQELRYFSPLTVTLAALVVGKVILIAHNLPLLNAFPHKPLIYNIFWKFFIYILCILLAWVLEAVIEFGHRYDNLHGVAAHLKSDMVSRVFWSSFLWLLAVFFIYIVASEFCRVLGKNHVKEMLFGKN